jgi:hypothetical protein
MPEKTEAEKAAKAAKFKDLHARQQVEVNKITKNGPPSTNALAALMGGGGINGGKPGKNDTGDAVQRQIQAASDPKIAACLDNVDKKFSGQKALTPVQELFLQNGYIAEAAEVISQGKKSMYVVLEDGQRYNVVSPVSPYAATAVGFEEAYKKAKYNIDNNIQPMPKLETATGKDPLSPKTRSTVDGVNKALDILKRLGGSSDTPQR